MAIQFDHTANGLVTITTTNAASPTPYTLRLPNGTGTNGQFISTDGTGNLSFVSAATSYESLTTKPAVNVIFTGDVTGSGNVLLATSGTNSLSITMDLSDTGVTAGTYGTVGTANTFAAFTVDVEGRITSASNVTPAINYAGDVTSASKPAINLTFTGGVTGSGGVVLSNSGTNSLSIGLTVANDSIALGTQTTGNYVANVVAGTGLLASGGGSEGSTVTVSLPNSGVTANTYGNARIVPAITVDAQGRITAASNVAIPPDVANILLTGNITGSANAVLGPGSTVISISAAVAADSVTLGTHTVGNFVNNVIAGAAILASGGGSENSTVTIAHADTSAQGNIDSNNSNGVVIQDISLGFDTFGHVTGASVATVDLDNRYLRLSGATSQTVQGNLVFEGNVNFLGNVFSTTANNLSIQENFIYLNDGNLQNNVDVGITGNYFDGVARHTGIFRDATDGYWKVFDNLVPDPHLAINIDTGNATYREANFKANVISASRLDITNINGNSVIATGNIIAAGFRTSAGDVVWNAGNDGAGSTLDADLLDGQQGTYYLAWANQTGKPSVNLAFTGDVTGSGSVNLTNTDTNTISVNLTVAADSIALGTDTTGNYVANVIAGTGLLASGGGSEGSTVTVSLPTSGVTAGVYGNANVVSQITVDAQGRITSAANVEINKVFNLINGNTITACGLTQHTAITTNLFNFFAGQCAGNAITSGGNNFFAGLCAGFCTTTGSTNTFIGRLAGYNNRVGCGNNFFGECAGFCNTSGNNNIFFGFSAGRCNVSGHSNNFFGGQAGSSNSTGRYNNFMGRGAGLRNTTGCDNTFLGQCAGDINTTGSDNFFAGQLAGRCNNTGSRNIYLGCCSGGNITTGNDNIIFGNLTSCVGLTDSSSNVIIFATGGVQRFCNNASLGNTTITGNIIAGSSGTFFGDGAGITGINYCNVTLNRPAANIILTGDLTGSANAILTPGSTVLSINATIASNSVALGTDTTGNYVANVDAGAGIVASGGGSETAAITIAHADTSAVSNVTAAANTYVSAVGFDTFGHVTSIATASISGFLSAESDTLATVTGRGATTATAVQFTNTTESTSTSTGAVRISGGLGVTGNLYVGRVIVSGTGHAANVGLDSAIIGGESNQARSTDSVVLGGVRNYLGATSDTSNSIIAGGFDNQIRSGSGAIIGSCLSTVDGTFNTIIGGRNSTIGAQSQYGVIFGSLSSQLGTTSSCSTNYSAIIGGVSACINIEHGNVTQDAAYIMGGQSNRVTGFAGSSGIIGSYSSCVTSAPLSTIINGYSSRITDGTVSDALQTGGSQFMVGPWACSTVSGKHTYTPRTTRNFITTGYGATLGAIWGSGAAQIGKQLLLGNLTGSGSTLLSSSPNTSVDASNTIALDRDYTIYAIKGTAIAANTSGVVKVWEFMSTARRGPNASSTVFVGSFGTGNAVINTLSADTGTSTWEMQLVRNNSGYVTVRATTGTTDNVKVLASIETTEMQYYFV